MAPSTVLKVALSLVLLHHVVLLLLFTPAAAQQPPARPIRPSLPRTFLKLELNKFPTLQGGCARITKTLQVGPTRQYKTITAALAAAKPFTRILVAPGTYIENRDSGTTYRHALDIKVDDLCIIGTGGPSRTRILADPVERTARGLMISSNRVTVSGFTVEGFDAGVFLGREDSATQSNITLVNLVILGKGADPNVWSGGLIVPYVDNRATGVPAVDGLLLSNVAVSKVQMGISCDFGPCHHWWLDRVNVTNEGGEGWGQDAFAIESGRQVIVTRSSFQGMASDGIDVKGPDVLVWRCSVNCERGRTGIKLWAGGDVQESSIDACDSLDAGTGAKFRYSHVNITRNSFNRRSYVGVWGYGKTESVEVEISDCIVRDSPDSGGFYFPAGSKITLSNNVFWDVGTRLIEYGNFADPENIVYILTTAAGLAEVERRGWGSGNKLGGV